MYSHRLDHTSLTSHTEIPAPFSTNLIFFASISFLELDLSCGTPCFLASIAESKTRRAEKSRFLMNALGFSSRPAVLSRSSFIHFGPSNGARMLGYIRSNKWIDLSLFCALHPHLALRLIHFSFRSHQASSFKSCDGWDAGAGIVHAERSNFNGEKKTYLGGYLRWILLCWKPQCRRKIASPWRTDGRRRNSKCKRRGFKTGNIDRIYWL